MALSLTSIQNKFNKMKIFKTLMLSFVLLAAFSSCKTKSNSQRVQILPKPRLLLVAETGNISETSLGYTIESAEIKENLLTLVVTYDSGCNPHQFSFVGSDMVAKSMPPIRSAKLILKNTGDEDFKPCTEKYSQTIDIVISSLAYQQIPGNEIYLKIDGYSERLKYTFY